MKNIQPTIDMFEERKDLADQRYKTWYWKSLFGMILICLLLIQGVVATSYKQERAIDIQEPCFNNGTYCSTSAICNITIYNPQSTVLVANQRMTNKVSYHNYTLAASSTDEIGIYKYDVSCCDYTGGVLCSADTFDFEITPSGFTETLGFYFIALVIIGGLIVLGFTIKDGWFVVLGGLGAIIFGIYSINSGIAGMRDMFITWGIGLFEIGAGSYLAIKSGIEMIGDM